MLDVEEMSFDDIAQEFLSLRIKMREIATLLMESSDNIPEACFRLGVSYGVCQNNEEMMIIHSQQECKNGN